MIIIQSVYMNTLFNDGLKNDGLKNVNALYEHLNYFDQYGGSFILFIVITILFLLLISYFHTMINVQPIIDDWPNQRCKPTIIPFAGLITHPEGVTAGEYTVQNFNYCTQNILSNITGYALQPLTYITNALQNIANHIQQDIQSTRGMFDKIRTSIKNVAEEIMGRLLNIMIPLMQIIISFKDITSKIQGTMTASLYTLLGSYYTLKSLMGAIAQFIIVILISISAMVAAFWAVPFTWGAAVANTAIFVAIAIPMAIILSFMKDTLHVSGSYKIPKIKCFDQHTPILMNDGSLKQIIDISVGDVLSNNNVVTAKMKVTTTNSDMYQLHDILVSDSHIVKYKDTWIPVSKHPQSIKIPNSHYKEPFLYCLNTSSKIIEINGVVFTDWDEIYDDSLDRVLHKIRKKNLNNVTNCEWVLKNIHAYMDYGFSKTTPITLSNGTQKKIHEISIGDVLKNGERVYGIVEINAEDIPKLYEYPLDKDFLVQGHIPDLVSGRIVQEKRDTSLYHLLTDQHQFSIGNNIFSDYNGAIDRLLED